MNIVSQQVSSPAYSDLGSPQAITPLFGNDTTPSLAEWQIQRAILKERWNAVLGTPSFKDFQRLSKTFKGRLRKSKPSSSQHIEGRY